MEHRNADPLIVGVEAAAKAESEKPMEEDRPVREEVSRVTSDEKPETCPQRVSTDDQALESTASHVKEPMETDDPLTSKEQLLSAVGLSEQSSSNSNVPQTMIEQSEVNASFKNGEPVLDVPPETPMNSKSDPVPSSGQSTEVSNAETFDQPMEVKEIHGTLSLLDDPLQQAWNASEAANDFDEIRNEKTNSLDGDDAVSPVCNGASGRSSPFDGEDESNLDQLGEDDSENKPVRSPSPMATECDIYLNLPECVKAWAASKNEVTVGLLDCDMSKPPVRVKSLNETYSIDDVNKSLEKKILVLKRCGIRNEDLSSHENWRICPNHLQLLTTSFPVEDICQVCERSHENEDTAVAPDSWRRISPFQQDLLIRYIPRVMVGQLLCDKCLAKVQSLVSMRPRVSEGAFVAALLRKGLVSEEVYSKHKLQEEERMSVLDVKPFTFHGLTWTILSKQYPLEWRSSKIPPLRFLSKLSLNYKSSSTLSVQEMVELKMTMQANMCDSLSVAQHLFRLQLISTCYEFLRMASTFTRIIEYYSSSVDTLSADEKQIRNDRLSELFGIASSDILMYPEEENSDNLAVWYLTKEGEEKCVSLMKSEEPAPDGPDNVKPTTFVTYLLNEGQNSPVLSLEATKSDEPSVRFLSTGVFEENEPLNKLDIWREIPVITCLEISDTIGALPEICARELLKKFVRKGIILPTSITSLRLKAKAVMKIIRSLQDAANEVYTSEASLIGEKIKKIVELKFYACDPWFSKGKGSPCGIRVYDHKTKATSIICGICPIMECDGRCAASTKVLPNALKVQIKEEVEDFVDEAVEEFICIPETVFTLNAENGELDAEQSIGAISEPCNDSSYYFVSPGTNDITFDFLLSDFHAAHDYLISECDPTFWTVQETDSGDLKLTRHNEVVNVSVQKNKTVNRAISKFTGPAIQYFVDELLPVLVKMTSAKFLDVESNGLECHDPIGGDELPVIDQSSVSSYSATSPSSSQATGGDGGKTGKREYQCFGCRKRFKLENSYVRHEAYCRRAGIPRDIRSFPDLRDGRKACPGCGRTFKGENLSYLKHLRTCSKIQPGQFKCPTCKGRFSTKKTLAKHTKHCTSSQKRKGVSIAYQGSKKRRIESVKPIKARNSTRVEESQDPVQSSTSYNLRLASSGSSKSANRDGLRTRNAKGFVEGSRRTKKEASEGRRTKNSSGKFTKRAVAAYKAAYDQQKVPKKWVIKKHKVICKTGNYRCPRCGLKFKLNQPYGKHLQNESCKKRKKGVKKAPTPKEMSMLYITIHPGIKGDDSVIGFNRVPSLRLICRGVQAERPLIKRGCLPSLTIKEALEVFYSIKRSDKTLEKEERWKYFTDRYIFKGITDVSAFLNSGQGILKVVEYFEQKVKVAKMAKNFELMKKWNDKLNVYLRMPFFDHFDAREVSKSRVFEYPSKDGSDVQVLCLNCSDFSCTGCRRVKKAIKLKKVPPSQMNSQTSTSSTPKRGPGRPPLKSHKCPHCAKSFKDPKLFIKHKQQCLRSAKKEKNLKPTLPASSSSLIYDDDDVLVRQSDFVGECILPD